MLDRRFILGGLAALSATPALADANNGNWQTARRWSRMLGGDYRIDLVERWDGAPAGFQPFDPLIEPRRGPQPTLMEDFALSGAASSWAGMVAGQSSLVTLAVGGDPPVAGDGPLNGGLDGVGPPAAADFAGIAAPGHAASFDVAVACLGAINKGKSEAGVSIGRGIRTLGLAANPPTLARLEPVLGDVMAAVRAESWNLAPDAALAEGVFAVSGLEFAAPVEA